MNCLPERIIVVGIMLVIALFCWVNGYGAEEVEINKIIQIESSGNPKAYNPKTQDIGLMQITPICLEDYNNYNPDYTTIDLYTPEINKIIGTWYINYRIPRMLNYYNIPDTIENRLIAYNWGIGNLIKYTKGELELPKETKEYLEKYDNIK